MNVELLVQQSSEAVELLVRADAAAVGMCLGGCLVPRDLAGFLRTALEDMSPDSVFDRPSGGAEHPSSTLESDIVATTDTR